MPTLTHHSHHSRLFITAFATCLMLFLSWSTVAPAQEDPQPTPAPVGSVDSSEEASEETPSPAISAGSAWARATRASATVGAVYLNLHNPLESADALISAESGISPRIELHTHRKDGEVMRMVEVPRIDVPATSSASLRPGGDHIMLFDLQQGLRPGTRFPITLHLESGQQINVEVVVGGATSKNYEEALAAAEAASATPETPPTSDPTITPTTTPDQSLAPQKAGAAACCPH